jgi:predicted methyltransferase MtxX (methanogen marker protein 4)
MAGNGKGMATEIGKENQERSTKESGTRRAAAKKSTPSTRKKETNAGKEAEEKKAKAKKTSDRKSAKPGADLLENAADAVVKDQCEKLAQGLADAAKKGNASCAKMLVTLAERVRIQKEAAKARIGRSAANLLSSEPDWPGVPEADSQAGSGAKETTQ